MWKCSYCKKIFKKPGNHPMKHDEKIRAVRGAAISLGNIRRFQANSVSEETREKCRQAAIKQKENPTYLERWRASNKKYWQDGEWQKARGKKISEHFAKNKKVTSEETKIKISKTLKTKYSSGELVPNLSGVHTKEAKAKRRLTLASKPGTWSSFYIDGRKKRWLSLVF